MSHPSPSRPAPSTSAPRSRVAAVLVLLIALVAIVGATPAAAATNHPDVDRLYCAYFLRTPDPAGQAYWYELRSAGYPLETIAEEFSLSEEFRSTYGRQVSTDAFIRLIYRNLFDREPDPEGLAYWSELLDTGQVSRGIVMTYFSDGAEFIGRVATVGCGNTGGGSGGGETTDPAVGARLAALTAWDTPLKVSADDRVLGVRTSPPRTEGGRRISTTCRPLGQPLLSRVISEFPAYAFSGPTLPGLVVEGAGIDDGDLRVLPLDRSAIRLVSDADSANPVRTVARPTTADVQRAVTELKRDADARLTGIDVVASDITFSKREVHSFEEASLQAGVSLHYEDETKQAGFSLDRSQNDAVERHSIVVRFVQPMFTISLERDRFGRPVDYFAGSVGKADIERLEAQGRIGDDNVPVVIDEVTYGRIMMFTLTSETATSASELEVAVNGAYGGLSGSADLTTRQQSLLRTSRVEMLSYGGDQDLAINAIRSGDLRRFFGPANTTTAAPLSMSIRTLGGELVDVADEATLQRISCTDNDAPFQFLAEVTEVAHANANIRVNGQLLGSAGSGRTISKVIPASMLTAGNNTVTFELRLGTCGWVFDNEVLNAGVRRRGAPGEAWSGRVWNKRFDGTACYFDWEVTVNTLTGRVSGP